MPATMHHTVDWLLWRCLHLLFTVFCMIGSAFSRAGRILSGAVFRTESSVEGQVVNGFEEKAKGVAVAVVFEDLQGPDWEGKVSQLVLWLSAVNVSHLTLFDAMGVLKRSQLLLETTFTTLEGRRDNQQDLGEVENPNPHQNSVEAPWLLSESSGLRKRKNEYLNRQYGTSGCGPGQIRFAGLASARNSGMKVELLSLHDGKESLVRAAKTVCENAYKLHYARHHQSKLPKLTEQDVNESLQLNGPDGPDPDLLLLFGKTRSLHGFPPWRLRLTEIVHMGSLHEMAVGSLVAALMEFSKKTHRYGR